MDPRVECEAITILATQGQEKYGEFLKSKGALDRLSCDEVAIITDPDFDLKAVCDHIRGRPTTASPSLAQRTKRVGAFVPETSLVMFNPLMDDNPPIGDVLLDLIKDAKELIQVTMYTFSDAIIFQALYNKANAGVAVELLLDASQLEQFTKMLTNQYNKSKFPIQPKAMTIGVITGLTRTTHQKSCTGCAHEKFMVSDSDQAFTGSYNFTWSAGAINRELAVFTYKHGEEDGLVIPYLQLQQKDLADTSTPYTWPN